LANKKTFSQEDHWNLRYQESSEGVTEKLSAVFERFKHKKNPLIKAIYSNNKGLFFKIAFFSLVCALLEYTGPFLINHIINYITDPNRNIQTGIFIVLGIILARILLSIFLARMRTLLAMWAIKSANAVNGVIYEKILRFSLIRSVEHNAGSLVNHIQVDSERLNYTAWDLANVITLPVVLSVGIYFMWVSVGISFLSGLGVILVMSLINFVFSKMYFKISEKTMEKKDERMAVATEILNGIKYIKMSGWENAFLKKISKVRNGELALFKKKAIVDSIITLLLELTPNLITMAIFGTYIYTGHDIDAKSAFTLVSTLMVLQDPVKALPDCVSTILDLKVSLDRISKFLLAEDIKADYIKRNEVDYPETAIKMTNGNFYWLTEEEKKLKKKKEEEEKEEGEEGDGEKKNKKSLEEEKKENLLEEKPASESSDENENENGNGNGGEKMILKDINLDIKKGSFVAILGDVGSGKSSLLFSLSGEMKCTADNQPEIIINGDMSQVPQQSWILNTTVKKNILFGQEFDQKKYKDVLKYSCLKSDLDILINKDETEIGEKGVNLSGGQKARVSLARALYKNSDIYLFDDPLSAVDAHVGNYILKECFMGYLKEKTRVLVTHKFESLKYVDYIYIFNKGKIVEEGTLETLQESATFQEIKEKYNMINRKQEATAEEEEEGKTDIEAAKVQKTEEQDTKLTKEISKEEEKKEIPPEDKELLEKLMLDEDKEEGAVGFKVWKMFFNYYGGWFFYFVLLLVMGLMTVSQVGANFWLSYWSDGNNKEKHSRDYYFTVYTMFGIGYAVFAFIQSMMQRIQSIKFSRFIHTEMFNKVIRAPLNLFFDRVPTGRILNRFSKDLATIDDHLSSIFGWVISQFFSFMADIFVCIIIGTMWVFPLAVLFFYICYRLNKNFTNMNREITRLESISKSPIVSFFSESLGGLISIRTYNEQSNFISKFHKLQDDHIKNKILDWATFNWYNLRTSFASIIIIGPVISIPLLLTGYDTVPAGMVALLIIYVIQINEDIAYLFLCFSYFEFQLVSLERCKKFAEIVGEAPAETKDPENVENLTVNWPARGSIEFKNYFVKYRPNLPHVIDNLSVLIDSGEKVGIVGRTGSGKSTFFLSLLRIIEPTHGSIFIDGVDISKVGLDDLRNKITVIPQDPMLFKGTLRENMDLLNQYTDQQLWDSLEKVCLKSKFEGENGLDTAIKDGGENLSAGEKQLLCIGRAILAQSRIVLIDEATSNIDPKTEQTILDTIHNCFQDCTVITVAHRLKTIINSDKIMVMGQGQLLEFDKPDKLIKDEKTSFHKLWMEYEHGHKI